MNEELIRQIQALIAQLEREKENLVEGSRAYEQNARSASLLATSLKELTSGTGDITRLTTELNRLFNTLAKGEAARLTVDKVRVRTKDLSRSYAVSSDPNRNIKSIDEFMASVGAVSTDRPDTTKELTKSELAARKRQELITKWQDLLAEESRINSEALTIGRTGKAVNQAEEEKAFASLRSTAAMEKALQARQKVVDEERRLNDLEIASRKEVQKLDDRLAGINPTTAAPFVAQEFRREAFGEDTRSANYNAQVNARKKEIEDQKKLLAEQKKVAAETARLQLLDESARDPNQFLDSLYSQNRGGHKYVPPYVPRTPIAPQDLRNQIFGELDVESEANKKRVALTLEEKVARQERLDIQRDFVAQQRKILQDLENQAQEAQRIENNRNIGASLPGGELASQALYKKAAKVDPKFGPETVKSVTTDPTSGITKVAFQYQSLEGIVRKATFTVDRFGQVLVDNQRRFRTFGDAVARDTLEFLKWTIAASLIYVPLQKLGQMMTDMIEIEASLAKATVVMNNLQADTAALFQNAADIAQATGESVRGVVDAYKDAYQATGGASDQTERFATASKLLTDAITLSKLTTLDQATAIDTLSAALRQVAKPGEDMATTLGRGSELLNKWVRVSKIANVDLEDLATGFAVVGDAAEKANVGTDKLNAIIASIAETTQGGAKEVANATKAIIASFQSDATKKELDKLGISYQDAEGNARDFLTIANEINQAVADQRISSTQLSQLTLTQGGGPRRQPIVSAFYSSIDKITTIEQESAKASASTGEASEAVGKSLDTVQTKVTQLGNAFEKLAMALGQKGGLLEGFKDLLDIGTFLVDTFSKLTSVMGKAGPVLLTAMAALAITNAKGVGFKANISSAVRNIGQTAFDSPVYGPITPRANNMGVFAQKAAPWLAGAAAIAVPALENLAQGRQTQAIGNAIGGAIGAGLGTSVAGPVGTMIGATLGSAIGEGIANSIEADRGKFSDLAKGLYASPAQPTATAPTLASIQKKAEDDALAMLKKSSMSDTWQSNLFSGINNFITDINAKFGGEQATPKQAQAILDQIMGTTGAQGGKYTGTNDTLTMLTRLVERRDMGAISKEEYDSVIKALTEALAPKKGAGDAVKEVQTKQSDIISKVIDKYLDIVQDKLTTNVMGPAAATRSRETIGNAQNRLASYQAAFGERMGGTPEQNLNTFGNVITFGDEANLNKLNVYAGLINESNVKLLALKTTDSDYKTVLEAKNQAMTDAIALIHQMNQEIASQAKLLTNVDMTGVVKNIGGGQTAQLTQPDFENMAKQARQNYHNELQANVDANAITVEEMAAKEQDLQDILIQYQDTFIKVADVPLDQFNKLLDDLKSQKKLMDDKIKDMSFQSVDMTSAEYKAGTSGYNALLKQLTALGYKENPDTTGTINITKDGFLVEHRDSKIIQYLLQQIEKNTSQLEGAYNLPEGASFWVPYQAAKMSVDSVNAAAGMGGAATPIDTKPAETEIKSAGSNVALAIDSVAERIKDANKVIYPADTVSQFDQFAKNNTLKLQEYTVAQPPVMTVPPSGVAGGYYTQQGYDSSSFFEPVVNALSMVGNTLESTFNGIMNDIGTQLRNLFVPQATDKTGLFNPTDLNQSLSNLSTKLNLTVNNNTTVQIDGRAVATAVKQYLRNDLVRYSGGSNTRTVSII